MSGIAGIVHLDGAPADAPRLRSMVRSMSGHGRDAQDIWTDGPVGLAHALLQTTDGTSPEQQPGTVDGHTWIAADCRLDGRGDLCRELGDRDDVRHATDAQLILHAYAAWGDRCVERLCGDFAFALWDGRQRRLLCARDHFGVKPF